MEIQASNPRLNLIEKIIKIPDVDLRDISSDGQTALILTNRTGSYQLATLPIGGGELVELTHGKERVAWARISRDSRQVAFSRDFGGKEQHQLFKISLNGGTEEQIAQLPPIRINDFDWSRKDDQIAFAGATNEFNGLWLLDTSTGTFRDIYRTKHWVRRPDWSKDDAEICFTAKTTEHPTAFEQIFLRSDGSSEPQIYTPKTGSENSGAHWHPTEPKILFKTDAQGRYDLAIYDKTENKLTNLKAGQNKLGFDFPLYGWLPDGTKAYYLASREGRTRLYTEMADGSGNPVEIQIPKGWHAGLNNTALKITPDGQSFLFSWSALSRPTTISRHDLAKQATSTLYENTTNLPLGTAEPVIYNSFDNLPIHGWFLKAQGGKKAPCILFIHGGPAWMVADEWNPIIQAYVTAGYHVFAPNIRGSTGYSAEFEHLNIHDIGGADLKDVEKAAEYIRSRPEVDPQKVAIAGASYGGYMTFLAMTKLPTLWAAGAAIVGITDWNELYSLSDAAFRSFVERYFGRPEENPELYKDRSPINFIENIQAPLIIIHRGNDSRCPLQPVQKFADRLKQLGKKYEMQVAWDAGHGFQTTENLVQQYGAVVDFLDRQLLHSWI